MSRRRTFRPGVLFGAALLLAGGWTFGEQEADKRMPTAKPVDVYVDDSFEAAELIERLEKLTGDGSWFEASRVADRVVTQHGRRLVRDGGDSFTHGGKSIANTNLSFTSVAIRVRSILADWPADGITVYRELFDGKAGRVLQEGLKNRDPDALVSGLEQHLFSSHAVALAEAAFELAIEAGHFTTGRHVCDVVLESRVADHVLNTFRARRVVANRLNAAWANQNNDRPHDTRDVALNDTKLRWHGKTQPLSHVMRLIERERQAIGHRRRNEAWPMFGGRASRDSIGSFVFDRTANLWRFRDFHRASLDPVDGSAESIGPGQAIDSGKLLNLFPIAGENLVFFHDARHVWAVHERSGTLAWTHDASIRGADSLDNNDSSATRWYSPAYGDGLVYASLGSETVSYYGYEASTGTSSVIALNATSGELSWRTTPDDLGDSLERCTFGSAPLFSEDSLFVIARRQRTFGFEDCYLVKLDARDGKLRWFAHLGSATTGGFGFKRSTFSIPTLVDGTIYVATNLGTIAAVSGQTGLVEWLRVYPRQSASDWRDISRPISGETMPWHYNAVLRDDDLLACKTLDAAGTMILNRNTGDIVRSIQSPAMGPSTSLYAFREGRLYGVSGRAFCVDVRTGEEIWSADLCDDDVVMGRGIATDSHLLVPCRRSLFGFDLKTGVRSVNPWESDDAPGNLMPLGDQIIVAGVNQVAALGRKANVWAKLHAEMAAREWDPVPAMDLAEIAFRSDERTEAANILSVAIERVQAYGGVFDERVHDRLFDDCMWFARDWPRRTVEDQEQITQLFKWAGDCAHSTDAHVATRLAFGSHLEQIGSNEKAVRQYQQVLNDRSMRRAIVHDSQPTSIAGILAQQQIRSLIARHGRGIYRKFDIEAAEWLRAAQGENALSLLERLITTRPNARAISDAFVKQGKILSDRGKPLTAARSFASAWAIENDPTKKASIAQSMARAFVSAGRHDAAYGWLTKAHREFPRTRVRDRRGKRLSILEYRDQLIKTPPTSSRPTLRSNITRAYELWFPDPVSVLKPKLGVRTPAELATVHILGAASLHVYDATTGDQRWEIDLATLGPKPSLLVATERVHVFATRHKIVGVDAKSGKTIWTCGGRPNKLDDPMTDPESFPSWFGHAIEKELLISLMDDGNTTAIDISTGQVRWNRHLDLRPTSPVIADGRLFAFTTSVRDIPSVAIFNLADGQLRTTIPLNKTAHTIRIHITADERLIVLSTQDVSAYTTDNRNTELIWRSPLAGHVFEPVVRFDLDGVYLTDDGEQIRKISYADGLAIWESEPLANLGLQGGSGVLRDGQLILMTDRSFVGLDTTDGRTLWQATLPHGNIYVFQTMTSTDIIGIETTLHDMPAEYVLRRFDHQRIIGLAEKESILLGTNEDIRGFALRDGALLMIRDQMIAGLASTRQADP